MVCFLTGDPIRSGCRNPPATPSWPAWRCWRPRPWPSPRTGSQPRAPWPAGGRWPSARGRLGSGRWGWKGCHVLTYMGKCMGVCCSLRARGQLGAAGQWRAAAWGLGREPRQVRCVREQMHEDAVIRYRVLHNMGRCGSLAVGTQLHAPHQSVLLPKHHLPLPNSAYPARRPDPRPTAFRPVPCPLVP